MKRTIKQYEKVILISVCLFSLVYISGCKSHRAANRGEMPPVESVVKIKLKGTEKKLVEEALSWLGTPYKYAGTEKGKGTDCSGMVLSVYRDVCGVKLPRNSKKQAEFCKRIKGKDVKPGDLVFFATGKDPKVISHVGIMIDDNQFIHASTKKGVVISDVLTDYYQRTFKMYGRVP